MFIPLALRKKIVNEKIKNNRNIQKIGPPKKLRHVSLSRAIACTEKINNNIAELSEETKTKKKTKKENKK